MRVGILGSGLMGGKLGTIFARAGHDVVFSYARRKKKLDELAREAAEVHVMFNNNRSNDAPVAAQRLRELYGQPVAPPAPEQLDLR